MKKRVLVRKFSCVSPGDDCPHFGFEIVDAKGVSLKKESALTSDGLDNLRAKKVDVVFTK